MDAAMELVERDCLLSPAQLKRLGEHKYSSEGLSILDELCMKRWWDWLVLRYPLWLAPNLITLVGFLCNLVAVLILAAYSPSGKDEAPALAYLFAAAALFAYQTLDATDGKQARRTKTSSPLGELFDHGCDSFSQIMVSTEICLSIGLGDHPALFLYISLFSVAIFYAAHWQTYVCGRLCFGRFDVTEAQLCAISVIAASGLFGTAFWKSSLMGVELRMAMLVAAGIGAVNNLLSYLNTIINGGAGKNGTTVADTSVIFPLLPLLTVILPPLMIYHRAESSAFSDHLVLFTFLFGLVGSKITNRIIIAHMSRSELHLWDSVLVGPALIMLNQYMNSPLPEYPLLLFVFLLVLANVLAHATLVCRQLCDHLHIACFTIPQPARSH